MRDIYLTVVDMTLRVEHGYPIREALKSRGFSYDPEGQTWHKYCASWVGLLDEAKLVVEASRVAWGAPATPNPPKDILYSLVDALSHHVWAVLPQGGQQRLTQERIREHLFKVGAWAGCKAGRFLAPEIVEALRRWTALFPEPTK